MHFQSTFSLTNMNIEPDQVCYPIPIEFYVFIYNSYLYKLQTDEHNGLWSEFIWKDINSSISEWNLSLVNPLQFSRVCRENDRQITLNGKIFLRSRFHRTSDIRKNKLSIMHVQNRCFSESCFSENNLCWVTFIIYNLIRCLKINHISSVNMYNHSQVSGKYQLRIF